MSNQQVLHQSKSFGAMRGSGSSGNGTSAPRAPLKRAARESCEDLLGCTQGEVHSSFHGPGTAANQTDDTFENQGTDWGTKPALARVGRVLQTRPHPKALPTSRRLGPAAHLVASLQVLAQCWLETAACAVARL